MNRWRFRYSPALLAVVALASLARADAPLHQYGLFDSSNLVILDNFTHLTWQRYILLDQVTQADALVSCQQLALGNWSTGWRVPSYKELLTLVDEVPHPEYVYPSIEWKWIDPYAFGGEAATPVDGLYWSSSVSPTSPTYFFTVSFHTGEGAQTDATLLEHVRCVHDMP